METSTLLHCNVCGYDCISPVKHLAREEVSSSQLHPDDPCLLYDETIKWGSRWRIVIALHQGQMLYCVDHMGEDDKFAIGGMTIASVEDDHPTYWNTAGEVFDIAKYTHDEERGGYRRTVVPTSTGLQWANQLVDKAELAHRIKNHIGVSGAYRTVVR